MPSVTIDYQICKGAKECGECYNNCPMEVFTIEGDKVVVAKEEECTGCGVCEDVCPTGAVKVKFE
ncbi:MAG TPA: 4Fe-4S dicluster domain-containing protein [Methanothermococcus okinawensis]|nr:4Fe-4S dicluster domain-containing protein [Methanothermococcus okinawensis]